MLPSRTIARLLSWALVLLARHGTAPKYCPDQIQSTSQQHSKILFMSYGGQPSQVPLSMVSATFRDAREWRGCTLEEASQIAQIPVERLLAIETQEIAPGQEELQNALVRYLLDFWQARPGSRIEPLVNLAMSYPHRFVRWTADWADQLTPRLTPNQGGSVFLGHASGDKQEVRTLHRKLTAEGLQCWLDEVDILPGQDWESEIVAAIRQSDFFLACLSRASVGRRGFVQREIRLALDVALEQPEGVAFIIPVRLEDCIIPASLRRWQWVDLFAPSGYRNLLQVILPPASARKIFLCFNRSIVPPYTRRIFEGLEDLCPAGMASGGLSESRQAALDALSDCGVLVGIVDETWTKDCAEGSDRVMDPVLVELRAAEELGIPIVPVFTDHTDPGSSKLPAEIFRAAATRSGPIVLNGAWEERVGALKYRIRQVLGQL